MKWEDDSETTMIGELVFMPRDNCEFDGLMQLVSIGFDPFTPEGQEATMRCLRKHFVKKEHE